MLTSKTIFVGLVAAFGLCASAYAATNFQVTSPQVKEGKSLGAAQVYNGFGCTGENLSPQLDWANAPAGTLSYAVTVYDPDAPTGSGWWHWLIYDLPPTTKSLPAGMGIKVVPPTGAKQARNDSGSKGYSGACPPPGSKPHHYIFTVYALKVDHLPVPEDASAAMISMTLNEHALAKATLTATYSR